MKKQAITWADGPVIRSRGLRAWASSLTRASPECDILICSPVPCIVPGTRNLVLEIPGNTWDARRWTAYSDAIRQSTADYVMLSDSRDVIFQSDPFSVINGKDQIVVANERFKAREHPWCGPKEKEVHLKVGGPSLQDKEVINGGMQVGRRDAMLTMACVVESIIRTKAISIDQSFLTWWFYERCPFKWSFGPPNWYVHGEAVRMKKQEIEARDGLIWTKNGSDTFEPAVAFHQYDRCGHADIVSRYVNLSESALVVLIAHFNENLDWLKKTDYDFQVFSKSPTPPIGATSLPNVGFEAHTWAWFFAENYDKLPEVTVCLQGAPFKHCPEPQIKDTINKMAGGQFMFAPLAGPGHGTMTWIDPCDHKGLPLLAYWKKVFKSDPPGYFYVYYGGQFAVHRNAVRSRPRSFWKKLAEDCKTKEDACSLERLWQFVFSGVP